MWRPRSSEEWERKKSYLIRSLFEDIPILSPILEGNEPESLSSPSNFINRAESPLPELIIEVEPKKPNPHDEPEELYDELAKEMWRMYRKDFLGMESSFENSSVESLNCGRIHDCIIFDEADDNTDEEGRSDSESFATNTSASNINSSSDRSVNSLNASPELMRQQPTFMSFETIPHRPNSESNSTVSKTINLSMEVDSKEFSDDVIASDQELGIAEGSGNETLFFVTSTPTRKRTSSFSTTTGHKRRLVSYTSSSSFEIVANAASQTSFSDGETDWSFFWSNFFKGIPKFYNVCSCDDHVCTT